MPDFIRHPVFLGIAAFAGMKILRYLIAGLILLDSLVQIKGDNIKLLV
jgi:hypothetical protein